MRALLLLATCAACNADPGESRQTVGYRDGVRTEGQSGERGNLVITEILWSGSVTNDGRWDRSDQFIEIRNQGARPTDLTGWHVLLTGTAEATWILPDLPGPLEVGDHLLIATKRSGCFPDPDVVLPELAIPYRDPFELTLRDRDERLIEPSGSETMPPFAGGYDNRVSRSMERVELMFGGRGTEPHMWHFYTEAEVEVPNNDRVAPECRHRTLASPGRANSPDYSGAYASGSFE